MEKFKDLSDKSKNLLEFFDKVRNRVSETLDVDIFSIYELDLTIGSLKCLEKECVYFKKMTHAKAIYEITQRLTEAWRGIKELFKQNENVSNFANVKLNLTLKFNDLILEAHVINQKSRGQNRLEIERKLDDLYFFDNNGKVNTPKTYGKYKYNLPLYAKECLLPI